MSTQPLADGIIKWGGIASEIKGAVGVLVIGVIGLAIWAAVKGRLQFMAKIIAGTLGVLLIAGLLTLVLDPGATTDFVRKIFNVGR